MKGRHAPQALSLLRIVAALLFLQHATGKLFGFPPIGMNPPALSLYWIAGVIELFGSLLLIGGQDIALAAVASATTLAATLTLGRRWLAIGFDPDAARELGVRPDLPDVLLLALVALVAVAALSVVGALLATALLVVPAATTRLWTQRLGPWQVTTVALVAAEGVAGLWLSVQTNAPPGATIAVVSGGVFALAALARVAPRRTVVPAAAGLLMLGVLAGCGSGAFPVQSFLPVIGDSGGRTSGASGRSGRPDWRGRTFAP